VADAVDAMAAGRPYIEPMSWEDCYSEVQVNKGKQFDPMVSEAAEKLWDKWADNRQDEGPVDKDRRIFIAPNLMGERLKHTKEVR